MTALAQVSNSFAGSIRWESDWFERLVTLQREYGFSDLDGTKPNWGNYAKSGDFWRQQQRSNARYLAPFTT